MGLHIVHTSHMITFHVPKPYVSCIFHISFIHILHVFLMLLHIHVILMQGHQLLNQAVQEFKLYLEVSLKFFKI